jgi:hypothetical protein
MSQLRPELLGERVLVGGEHSFYIGGRQATSGQQGVIVGSRRDK